MNRRRNNGENKDVENKNVFASIKQLFVYSVFYAVNMVERGLFLMVSIFNYSFIVKTYFLFNKMICYDNYVYSVLKQKLPLIVKQMPRCISFRNKRTILIINSNIITLLRTMLFIPIVWFIKHNYSVAACFTVIIHAFFGHFDGIVARVHGVLYPNQDDPHRSRFVIAFCNKVVNLLIFIAMMQTISFENCSYYETVFFCGIIYSVIVYDVVTAVLRVQSYFEAILIKFVCFFLNFISLQTTFNG
jgi:hypothetical protein